MPLIPLFGHVPLQARLLASLRRGALPQSLLLHGDAGIGKQRLALWLASALLCPQEGAPCGACSHCRMCAEVTHPDLTWVFPVPREKDSDPAIDEIASAAAEAARDRAREHGLYARPSGSEGIHVATTRMLVRAASQRPALAARRVLLIGDAERMVSQVGSEQAANAFLKLLEEPPPGTWIVLTSSVPNALLPTIRSRVVAVRMAPMTAAEVRAWLAHPAVASRLPAPTGRDDPRIALAAGAPGRLLSGTEAERATTMARRFLESARSGQPTRAISLALAQGPAGARGSFTDLLEALEQELRGTIREAIQTGQLQTARRTAEAITFVEETKAAAAGNVNPQLLSWDVLASISRALAPH